MLCELYEIQYVLYGQNTWLVLTSHIFTCTVARYGSSLQVGESRIWLWESSVVRLGSSSQEKVEDLVVEIHVAMVRAGDSCCIPWEWGVGALGTQDPYVEIRLEFKYPKKQADADLVAQIGEGLVCWVGANTCPSLRWELLWRLFSRPVGKTWELSICQRHQKSGSGGERLEAGVSRKGCGKGNRQMMDCWKRKARMTGQSSKSFRCSAGCLRSD